MKNTQRFFSIKWKISAIFVAVSVCLISLFVWTAKSVFENDKIAYIFDSQQAQVNSIAKNLKNQIEEAIFQTKVLSNEYSLINNSLTDLGKENFAHQKNMLSIELFSPSLNKTVALMHKEQFELPQINRLPFVNTVGYELLSNGLLTLVIPLQKQGSWLQAYTVLDLSEQLPQADSLSLFAIQKNGKLLANTSLPDLTLKAALNEILNTEPTVKYSSTSLKKTAVGDFLVARSPIGAGNIEVLSVVSSSQALRALKTLMQKMTVFILFSISMIIAVSIIISIGLTKNLEVLRGAAEQISIGKFITNSLVRSKDEFGILSQAFEKMSFEIQRLLKETKDKERMEAELKTAKLVQESLLPNHQEAQFKNFNIHGISINSSECGGDWWYHFSNENYLYIAIADATGHGTPAALITAAARSIFSKIERNSASLSDMMTDWNHAICACSKHKVFMTAILIKIDLHSGQVEAINSSHELPLYLSVGSKIDNSIQAVDLEINQTLGEQQTQPWKISQLTMSANSQLILYTDGILAIENPDGKIIREKYLHQTITKHATNSCSATDMAIHIQQTLMKYKKDRPLPDDVTYVIVHRTE